MGMGEENPAQAPEAGAALQDLSLGALAAVDKHAVRAERNEKRRQHPFGGRRAGRRAQEQQIERPEENHVSLCARPPLAWRASPAGRRAHPAWRWTPAGRAGRRSRDPGPALWDPSASAVVPWPAAAGPYTKGTRAL